MMAGPASPRPALRSPPLRGCDDEVLFWRQAIEPSPEPISAEGLIGKEQIL
jgi:hypothetical protein